MTPKWSALFLLLGSEYGRFHAASEELGLSTSQAQLLWGIEPGSPAPMSSLAERLGCHASNVTGLVDRLESQGLVVREPGQDRRVKAIALTDAGVDVRARLIARMDEPPPGLARLEESERLVLLGLLAKAFPS